MCTLPLCVADDGVEQLITFAHTAMVALDDKLKTSVPVPPLASGSSDECVDERSAMTLELQSHRKKRREMSMSLNKMSVPPSDDEVQILHDLFREVDGALKCSEPSMDPAQATHS